MNFTKKTNLKLIYRSQIIWLGSTSSLRGAQRRGNPEKYMDGHAPKGARHDGRGQANSFPLGIVALLTLLTLSGCAPVIIGGGAVVGALATRDKGLTGTVSDSQISTVLKTRIYSHSSDLYTKIGMNVQNGEVLLTGSVPTADWQADAERIAWEVNGVKQVINQIEVSEGGGLGSMAKDGAITTQVKSHLLFDGNIRSLNYSIKTVGGVVYIMGDAQSQEELNLVSEYASKVSGVKKVMNYARVKGEPAPQ